RLIACSLHAVVPIVDYSHSQCHDHYRNHGREGREIETMPSMVPPPPPTPPGRRPAGYQIRADLDDAVRAYQAKTGAQRKAIIDQALEEYLTARGMWPTGQ